MILDCVQDTRCHRKLVAGQVKRQPQQGPLVGYWIACPACGAVRPYLASETTMIEHNPGVGKPKTLTGMTPTPCQSCTKRIFVSDNQITAE